jgi:S-(hydroxymethyl)glutathione dehydrogenase / alcohol dehydrogenase
VFIGDTVWHRSDWTQLDAAAVKRITRSSYGGAKPQTDFPLLAQAYLDGRLKLDEMISARIGLEQINQGFAALKRGETIRSVVMFG